MIIANKPDRIYTFKLNKSKDSLEGELIQQDELGFDIYHPIESLPVLENKNISKVYLTDNKNQPRVINIKDINIKTKDNKSFDFVQPLSLNEEITITKNATGGGVFPSGVIQYAFTYFNKYSQETNIFYVSPIYYISFKDRAGSPEESISNSFTINIKYLDTRFDFLRIYSIIRTSIDAQPLVRRVVDIKTTSEILFTDSNTTGEIIDPSSLLYIGGEELTAKTIEAKDNTLFLGNIKLLREPIGNIPLVIDNADLFLKDIVRGGTVDFVEKYLYSEGVDTGSSHYPYKPESLFQGSKDILSFKHNDVYRFGIQAQHKSGVWSEALWISDVLNTQNPRTSIGYTGATPSHVNVYGSSAEYSLSNTSVVNTLLDAGYVRVRGIYVPPSINDRNTICQGILNPTISNVEDRSLDAPFVQSSWFLRPMPPSSMSNIEVPENGTIPITNLEAGSVAEFRHLKALPQAFRRNSEVAMASWDSSDANSITYNLRIAKINAPSVDFDLEHFVSLYKHDYFVDQSIQTMYSPDIEFDDSTSLIDTENLKLRIVGFTNLTGHKSFMDMTLDTAPQGRLGGVLNRPVLQNNYNSTFGYKTMLAGLYYQDDTYAAEGSDLYGWLIHPWHFQGSLHDPAPTADPKKAVLGKKNMSTLRYSGFNTYFTTPWEAYDSDDITKNGISKPLIMNDSELEFAKFSYHNDTKVYKGNIDKILQHGYGPPKDNHLYVVGGLKVAESPFGGSTPGYHSILTTSYISSISTDAYIPFNDAPLRMGKNTHTKTDPVVIKYKTCPHVVFSFNKSRHEIPKVTIAPARDNLDKYSNNVLYKYPYSTDAFFIQQNTIDTYQDNKYGGVWLAELYREVDPSVRYGGTTDEALENNQWIPCGEPIRLQRNLPATIQFTEGDTYIQRYDCLRTYPHSLDDYQTNVEIVSFLCETHVNLDSRYDRNRGNIDNRVAMPSNFNLLNPVYNQRNNFFSYRVLDYERFSLNDFPTSITWSGVKTPNSLVDKWTNINMNNIVDLDGTYGELNSLNITGDRIIGFQDTAMFELLYNNRIQISPSDGIPIEVATSGKVEGKRYITNDIGCRNKWNIINSSSGLYFIDSESKAIYYYNGQLKNISATAGFNSWSNVNMEENNEWNPLSSNSFISSFDKSIEPSGVIYFTNSLNCLSFSESLGTFTSFHSYHGTPFMFNLGDNFIALRNNVKDLKTTLWNMNVLDYPEYFGESKKAYSTILINKDANLDKTFWGIEFRADSRENNTLIRTPNISSFKAWNEHQYGTLNMTYAPYLPSTLKESFRVWKANFPKVSYNYPILYNTNMDNPHRIFNFDNIRNTWTFLKMTTNNYDKPQANLLLHDISVYYNV